MSRILAIGIATLDIINVVAEYPAEEAEIRALSQRVCRGGNATNTLVILSQLGHQCSWGGVWVEEADGRKILADLANYQINTQYCRHLTAGKMPTSYVILNKINGSRTIVHYRDLPEFSVQDFQRIELSAFDWLHFEGRHITDTVVMIQQAKREYPHLPISVEIEKPRDGIEQLFQQADILLFSKSYAQSQGYQTAHPFLLAVRQQTQQAQLICAWGKLGGYALTYDNVFLHSSAHNTTQIVDTLGAGDTFNAGIIHNLCHQKSLAEALQSACQLASQKCGKMGLII